MLEPQYMTNNRRFGMPVTLPPGIVARKGSDTQILLPEKANSTVGVVKTRPVQRALCDTYLLSLSTVGSVLTAERSTSTLTVAIIPSALCSTS